jgi:Lrp/AsnC family leucine-responsive transcriptional regulator
MATNRRQNDAGADGGLLDATNLRLLAELQADARLSLAELGRRVGLSSPAVAERLQRLERDGVILGYHARIDPRALGLALSAVIRVRPAPGQLHKLAAVARDTPEIVECRRITGDDCYIALAHVRSVEHLEEVIDRFTSHGQTTTSIVQSSPVPPRGLDLGVGDPAADGR